MNNVLPSWADAILNAEVTKNATTNSARRRAIGLQGIIDAVDLKNVDKSDKQPQK